MDFAVNFLASMCGQSKDDEIVQDRMAIISHYVTNIYDASWQEWWKRHTELRSKIARKAITLKWMQPRQRHRHFHGDAAGICRRRET